MDAVLLERRSILNRRKSKLLPLVGERMRMSEVLARQLQALGLERKPKPVPSLAEYLEQRQREREGQGEAGGAGVPDTCPYPRGHACGSFRPR